MVVRTVVQRLQQPVHQHLPLLLRSRFYRALQVLQEETLVLQPRMVLVELEMAILFAVVGRKGLVVPCTDVSVTDLSSVA